MQKIIFDMDGVLADFFHEPNYMERFESEKGFFKRLKPIGNNHKIIQRYIDLGFDIYILSSSPNEQADKDKIKWLNKYIPNLTNDKIIFCRNGQDKADFVNDIQNSILIDDHTPNLIKWKVKGGKALKYINDINDKKGIHKAFNIKEIKDLKTLRDFV